MKLHVESPGCIDHRNQRHGWQRDEEPTRNFLKLVDLLVKPVEGGPFLGFLARLILHVNSEIYVIDSSKNLVRTAEHGLAYANFINHKSQKLNINQRSAANVILNLHICPLVKNQHLNLFRSVIDCLVFFPLVSPAFVFDQN